MTGIKRVLKIKINANFRKNVRACTPLGFTMMRTPSTLTAHCLRQYSQRALFTSTPKRKIVRDPRRGSKNQNTALAKIADTEASLNRSSPQPLPWDPRALPPSSIGSSLGSYMLAGAGMALGFTLVGLVLGG